LGDSTSCHNSLLIINTQNYLFTKLANLSLKMFSHALKSAVKQNARLFAVPVRRAVIAPAFNATRFTSVRHYSDKEDETFEEFSARYEKEFDEAYDLFEVQVSSASLF